MKFTKAQKIACFIAGPVLALILPRDPWRLWTDIVGDLIGGILIVAIIIFVAKMLKALVSPISKT